MSATLTHEFYRLPAGVLAVVVHGAFFALLYFGFSWQTYTPALRSVEVDLWQSLPDETVEPPAKPVVEAKVEPERPPEKIVKPDIALPDKKKVVAKPVIPKPIKKKIKKKIKTKPAEAKSVKPNPEARIAEQQAAREQSEKAEAIGRVVDEYIAKIQAKIRRNIVMPPDVEKGTSAEFYVTLLPGGAVLPPRLLRTSGNAAYDNAVERAILKSDPLPLPQDVALFNRFRELKLEFKTEK